jgi:hypothetical protein
LEQEYTHNYNKANSTNFDDKYQYNSDFNQDSLKALHEIDRLLVKQIYEIGLPTPENSFLNLQSRQMNGRNSDKLKMFQFTTLLAQSLELKFLRTSLHYHLASPLVYAEKNNYDKFFFLKVNDFL